MDVRQLRPRLWPWPVLFVAAAVGVGLGCPSLVPGRPLDPRAGDEAWEPPPFDSLSAGARRGLERYSGRDEYERARLDPGLDWRRWRYRSDSLVVIAFGCLPRAGSAGPVADRRTAPRGATVVYCRGSYVQQDMAPASVPVFHRLARAGFRVVAPQYRGSEGGEGRDDMGGADLEDVQAAIRLAAALPGAKRNACFVYGESRGGMMALQAIRDRAPIRAAATVGAFTDLDTLFRDDPRAAAMAPRIWPDYAERAGAIAERRSALRWSDRLRVPLLILHGREDGQVRPWHSERLADALTRTRTPHRLHVMAGAGHVLGERSRERDSLVVDWFLRHGR